MIIEIGRLTKDVELSTVTVGDDERMVLNNRIAIRVNEKLTTYIDITVWGKLAEFSARHFKKGDELYIEGHLRSKEYEREGIKINQNYILVENIKFTHGNIGVVKRE